MSTRRDRYKAALVYIRDNCGKVCSQFETCMHPACRSSYAAWATADKALLKIHHDDDDKEEAESPLETSC